MIKIKKASICIVALLALAGASCTLPTAPSPKRTPATAEQIAKAQEALIAVWHCRTSTNVTNIITLKADTDGHIVFEDFLITDPEEGEFVVSAEMKLSWQVKLADGKPSKLLFELDATSAELIKLLSQDGVDYAKFSGANAEFQKKLIDKLSNGIRTSDITSISRNNLQTKTENAINNCVRSIGD